MPACRAGLVGLAAIVASPGIAWAEAQDVAKLTLEELAQVRVVTVSRRSQTAMETAAAVTVVSADDIRRTGATTLPDAFRTAPGVQTSRIDADEWALSVRGFASRLPRSVLVMIDGRSVWTPLFAGVFWNAQDALLEDVDRVEVVRGPGGASWGANAMNGVINVVTRPADKTPGVLATASAGGAETIGGLRWGGRAGARTHYRVYGKYFDRDGTRPTSAEGYGDSWRMGLGGFRVDSDLGARGSLTVQGDAYGGEFGQRATIVQFAPPFSVRRDGDGDIKGGNLLTRWKRELGSGEISVQAYYDHTLRRELYFEETRNTFDVDASHRLRWGGRHETIWGLSYRASTGRFQGEPFIALLPEKRRDDIAGLFVNEEARLWGDRLRLTAGTKLEWNDYSGWNVQPNARLAWVSGAHTVWASGARAVRTSSRVERDVSLYTSLDPNRPLFARTLGSTDFRPESVLVAEAGYKARAGWFLGSLALFRADYDDLAGNEVGTPGLEGGAAGEPARTVIPVRFANLHTAVATGAEVGAVFEPFSSWRLRARYSVYDLDVKSPPPAPDPQGGFEGNTPRHQAWLVSYFNPTPTVDVDLVLRHMSAVASHKIAAFTELDARIAHRPWRRLELALVGRNLLRPHHAEFGGGFLVERHVQAQATLRWE